MISTRPLVLAAFLALAALDASAAQTRPIAATENMEITVAELMQATALDDIFTQYGASIALAPQEQGAAFTASMRTAWTGAAREVFAADAMHAELAAALEGTFSPEEIATFATFFRSDFGRRVSAIEREVTALPPAEQASALDEGLALASESAARRHTQIEEMLKLVSADIATSMVRQSVRGLLIGMAVNGQHGDIEVPWDEIDAQLATLMPGIEADITATQRAMMFYGYRDLSEEELDSYLEFLRTDAAQKFYAVAAYSVGRIITDRMQTFGETVARKLAQVNV